MIPILCRVTGITEETQMPYFLRQEPEIGVVPSTLPRMMGGSHYKKIHPIKREHRWRVIQDNLERFLESVFQTEEFSLKPKTRCYRSLKSCNIHDIHSKKHFSEKGPYPFLEITGTVNDEGSLLCIVKPIISKKKKLIVSSPPTLEIRLGIAYEQRYFLGGNPHVEKCIGVSVYLSEYDENKYKLFENTKEIPSKKRRGEYIIREKRKEPSFKKVS